ncbi:phage tail protein [Pectobacterium aroidearum]|uniref:phage tail-collar fiber domain-containing protein n=1 Tax=Pectobacterium aroidearum TaxID=1201031 RepID=UPI0032EFFA45
MSAKYFALLTNIGAAKLANATALGSRLNITQMAVGDGGGVLPTPNPTQTALIGEKRRAAINTLSTDPANPNQIISEQVIPENEGGWWIREIGLFDDSGDMIAIANCPETYKPQLQEGSGRIQTVRMILIVSSTDAVTLKIDPAVVLATRSYVDSAINTHEKSRTHPDGTLTAKGFVQLSNATNSDSETLAATPKAVKAANDNANSRLPSGGTAVAATKLAAARTIGGVAFDGTANINLPGVNTAGNQSTTGNAATATKLATARKIAGVEFDGTADIALNAASVNALAKEQNGADIPDKALFRQNTGLVKQTSVDDTTTGALMINGAHGLGADARPRPNGSTGGVAGCGFFSYSASQPDNPFPGSGSSGIHVQEAPNYGWDLLGRDGGGAQFKLRQISFNTPSEWLDVYHSGNLTPAEIGALSSTDIAGMPQLFPGAVAPTGWLKCNGQQFDTAQFPVLASRYPSGFLPDLRGEFVRGWDDGRGADSGRSLLSAQSDAIRNITGSGALATGAYPGVFSGAFKNSSIDVTQLSANTFVSQNGFEFDASRVVPTANENRPRNIAFNYIVRAA